MTSVAAYLNDDATKARQLAELSEWLRIPSISTLSAHADDIREAAIWLVNHLQAVGLENVELIADLGHPLVYADWLHAGVDKPTILIYGHYDVQPVDPLDLWESAPFEPTVRSDNLFRPGGV